MKAGTQTATSTSTLRHEQARFLVTNDSTKKSRNRHPMNQQNIGFRIINKSDQLQVIGQVIGQVRIGSTIGSTFNQHSVQRQVIIQFNNRFNSQSTFGLTVSQHSV